MKQLNIINAYLFNSNKLIKIALVLILLCYSQLFAFKVGFINLEKILKLMPEYAQAQREIDQISIKYQKEIETMNIDRKRKNDEYLREEILLTEEMKEKKLKELNDQLKEIEKYRNKIFGEKGVIFNKRLELTEPVLDKVNLIIKKICRKEKIDHMIDLDANLSTVYANPIHIYNDQIIELLEKEKEQ